MKKAEQLAEKILLFLKNKGINHPLALVGSAINNNEFNDLDLLMVVDDIRKVKEELYKCFNNYNLCTVDDAIKITDFADVEISIAIYSKNKVEDILNNFQSGKNIICEHRIWCIGYWLPESFIENLKTMRVINDNNDYLKNIQLLARKNSIYIEEKILIDCLEEIKIKYDLIKKVTNNTLEYSFLKNDIILAIVRGLSIINNKNLFGFKRLDELVKRYNDKNLNLFINDNLDSINNIIAQFNSYLNWNNKFYLGTWQFSGDFKKLSEEEIINLIIYAKKSGVNQFDTALVYGGGNVEKILAKVLEKNDKILTKIPAKIKPEKDELRSINVFYDYDYMENCILKSLANLNREYVDVCLLHNWSSTWNEKKEIIQWLNTLKDKGYVKKIGISLPNGYLGDLSDTILKNIDVIEAPYNIENKWIINNLEKYKQYGIEIILRSLFLQGRILKDNNFCNPQTIINEVKKYNTSLVIGMTTEEQISDNIKVLRGN